MSIFTYEASGLPDAASHHAEGIASKRGHLLWLPARSKADAGRDLGDCRPGLTGRLQGGDFMAMPLAWSLGASQVPQPDVLPPVLM